MAKKSGVWNLQQVRDKQLQDLWTYSSTNGNLFSWGQGQNGALGLSDTTQRSSPTQVGSGEDWESLGHQGRRYASGGGLKSDGTLWVWGRNSSGGLGQNDTIARSSPVQVPGTTWDKFSIGIDKGASIKTDGTLWVWGRNDAGDYAGALGQNNVVNYSSPVQIPGTTWKQVSNGAGHLTATKTDGTLWVWGDNSSGVLGLNEPSNSKKSSPTQVPGTTWNHTWTNNNNTFASKTDGTLWGIGRNTSGQLGQNDTIGRSSPIQIPGTTWATTSYQIGVGYFAVHAIKTDGTLWTWGYNVHGQLGQNESYAGKLGYSSPTQVPGTTWAVVDGGGTMTGAVKTDGTLWTWGYNVTAGQLGTGDAFDRSSPIQIPGTWKNGEGALNLGYDCMQAIKM